MNDSSMKIGEVKMWKCNNGYSIEDDGTPPLRCHYDGKYDLENGLCKNCHAYNKEYDLVNRAIESAKCRIYRLNNREIGTTAHQKKADNQVELMNITIKALEHYLDNMN